MIQLQKRDYEILRLCYEQRFLTREHLNTFFYFLSEAYRRVKELENAGLITRHYYPILGRRYLIKLTHLGERTVQERFGILFPPMKTLNLNVINHDILVTSVRLKLSQFWDGVFVPERAIQAKEYPEIPDGIFFFQSGKGIAIEVENSDKGRARFLNRLEGWKNTSSIALILYVTPHVGLFKVLSRYIESVSTNQPLGVVLWDELEKGKPLVRTRMGEIDLFSRREF